MLINTKFFNEVEVRNEDVIVFNSGIPGFQDLKKFALIKPEEDSDFTYMQSIDRKNVCFIMVPPAIIVGNYDIEISDEAVREMGIENPEDAKLYAILTIPEDVSQMTANLKAPVIINTRNNKAVQEILNDDNYSIRHRVLKEEDSSC